MMRIGSGYDVHAFTEGDHFQLGGVKIKHNRSLLAHSDGDVLLHALCDALLGALALGDIGQHFPDNNSEFENINSRVLLKKAYHLVTSKFYKLSNCDCTIIAQSPKMAPYILTMRQAIAEDLGVSIDQISIKATTTEKLGFEGKEQGIAVHATVLLQKMDSNAGSSTPD